MAEKKFVSVLDGLLEEGAARGRLEGERRLLLRQIRRRFGPVPADVEARVQAADDRQLESWAERILEARDLAALFSD